MPSNGTVSASLPDLMLVKFRSMQESSEAGPERGQPRQISRDEQLVMPSLLDAHVGGKQKHPLVLGLMSGLPLSRRHGCTTTEALQTLVPEKKITSMGVLK